MAILIHENLITDLLSNPALKKSDTRTVIFLLQNPGALSSEELAAGIGVSKKSANKSVNRLIAAKVIQPGAFQDKRRTLNIPAREIIEPSAATEESNKVRFDRLEAMIGTLMDTKGAGFDPAPIHDGTNGTLIVPSLSCVENMVPISGQKEAGMMPVCSHVDQQENIKDTLCLESGQKGTADESLSLLQDKTEPVIIPKGTTGTEQGTNGTQNDSIVADLDNAIIRAHARLAALASFDKEKQKQSSFSDTCSPASIGEVFKSLFGVNVPPGFTDMTAVETMVRRKQGGKLDNVKSPIAYLNSLSGKIQPPIVAAVSPPPPAINKPLPVTETRLDHEAMFRIDAIWDAMDHSQYKEKALAKDQTGKKYPVPVELLARQIFNAEMMAAGGRCG
jgi:hypothetical protein